MLVKISRTIAVNPFWVKSISKNSYGNVIVSIRKNDGTIGISDYISDYSFEETIKLFNKKDGDRTYKPEVRPFRG